MKEPMSTAALMRYMQTCHKDAVCSITYISQREGQDIFELHWDIRGKCHVEVFSEGGLFRDSKRLQKVFNKLRTDLR